MHVATSVSTTFAASHDRHRVNLLLTLTGEAPSARAPVNAALVLDCSGSMTGDPLSQACDAALRFASFLTGSDRLTVVAFADEARLLYGPGPGNAPAAGQAIRQIRSRGWTNLSGGWLEGHRHVGRQLLEGINRVLLLTDGLPNRGLTDSAALRGMIGGAADGGVSTTCIGFGPDFNEELLRDLSGAGQGRFWYVESADQMTGAFEGEVEGLVSLAAQNVVVEISLCSPGVAGVSLVPALPAERTDDGGWRIQLGDLYAVEPRSLGLVFHADAGEVAGRPIAEVRVRADLLAEGGIEHRTMTLPVMATLDGQDHVDAVVESSFLQFAVAAAREEAVRQADAGNLEGAAMVLREVAGELYPYATDPVLNDVREDLEEEARRLAGQVYRSEDRKYHLARSAMARDGRARHEAKLDRRPRA